jgi:hypothetical protein
MADATIYGDFSLTCTFNDGTTIAIAIAPQAFAATFQNYLPKHSSVR